MDPAPLDFSASSAIQPTSTNITMRAAKPDKALQVFTNIKKFLIEYI